MYQYLYTLTAFALIAGAMSINIARYPAVWKMLEQKQDVEQTAESNTEPEKEEDWLSPPKEIQPKEIQPPEEQASPDKSETEEKTEHPISVPPSHRGNPIPFDVFNLKQ